MRKLRDSIEYSFCFVFAGICLLIVYGLATFLSALEIARIVKPIYLRPRAAQPIPLPDEQKTNSIQPAA